MEINEIENNKAYKKNSESKSCSKMNATDKLVAKQIRKNGEGTYY